jgi:DNA-binding response OmpR family regulator
LRTGPLGRNDLLSLEGRVVLRTTRGGWGFEMKTAEETAAPRTKDGTRRVLIVDDETDITRSLELGLGHHGFSVDAFNDPLEALQKVRPGVYDVAVFDIRMPGITGFELCRRFHAIDSRPAICFMTAYDIHAKEFHTLFPEMKVAGFFTKPFSIDKMAERLRRILEEQQASEISAQVTLPRNQGLSGSA